MKTGEEKFDDEIRQKLRHSEVTPPAGFFDQIVPPRDKRRGFLWMWFAGIMLLGLTAYIVKIGNGPGEISHKRDREKQSISTAGSGKEHPEKLNNNQQHKEGSENIASSTISTNSVVTSHHTQPQIGNNIQNQITRNGNAVNNRNYPDPSGNYTASTQKRDKGIKYKKDDTANNMYYENRKPQGATLNPNYDLLYIPVPALPYNETTSLKQQIRIMKPDQTEFDPHIPTKFGIEVVVSMLSGYSAISENTSDTMAVRLLNSVSESDFDSKGFDIGVLGTYAINNRFKLSAGIHYAQRKQEFYFDFTEYYDQLHVDTIKYYILFPFTPPQLVTKYDSTILHLSRKHTIDHELEFKAFSVAADLGYQVPAGRFLIEPQAGLVADVYSTTGGSTNFNPGFENKKGDDHFDNKIQLRAKAGLQLGFTLTEKYNIFLHTGYQLALTSLETTESFYEEKTNLLTFGAGIHYTIFKTQAAKTTP